MAEMTSKIGYQGINNLKYERGIKIYSSVNDIAGEDFGVRIQTNKGVGFVPCVDSGNGRASEIGIQTEYGKKYLACNKQKSVKDIFYVGFRLLQGRYYEIEETKYGDIKLELYGSFPSASVLHCTFDFYDRNKNIITDVVDENFDLRMDIYQAMSFNVGFPDELKVNYLGENYDNKPFTTNKVRLLRKADTLNNRDFFLSIKNSDVWQYSRVVIYIEKIYISLSNSWRYLGKFIV
jgi:hypothetical protein